MMPSGNRGSSPRRWSASARRPRSPTRQHQRLQLSPGRVDGRRVPGRARTNDDDVTYVGHCARLSRGLPTPQQILGRGDSRGQPASGTDVMTWASPCSRVPPPTPGSRCNYVRRGPLVGGPVNQFGGTPPVRWYTHPFSFVPGATCAGPDDALAEDTAVAADEAAGAEAVAEAEFGQVGAWRRGSRRRQGEQLHPDLAGERGSVIAGAALGDRELGARPRLVLRFRPARLPKGRSAFAGRRRRGPLGRCPAAVRRRVRGGAAADLREQDPEADDDQDNQQRGGHRRVGQAEPAPSAVRPRARRAGLRGRRCGMRLRCGGGDAWLRSRSRFPLRPGKLPVMRNGRWPSRRSSGGRYPRVSQLSTCRLSASEPSASEPSASRLSANRLSSRRSSSS